MGVYEGGSRESSAMALRAMFQRLLGSPAATQSASVAKDRLKIMITQQRQARQDFGGMNYHDVKRDVVAAVSRHWSNVDTTDVQMDYRNEDGCEVLELTLRMPPAT